MKPRKNTILVMLLGLLLFAFAVGMAQTPSQGDQKKKAEACCSMESCCNDESCDMKKDGTAQTEGKDSCCSDSCDMKDHDAKMKHDKDGKHECCNTKNKDKAKNKKVT